MIYPAAIRLRGPGESWLASLRAEPSARRASWVLLLSVVGSVAMLAVYCIVLRVRLIDTAPILVRGGFFLAAAALLHRFNMRVARDFALTFAILIVGGFLHPAIEHLGLRFGYPLISLTLARADAALGLDWSAYHDWVRAVAALRWATLTAYNSFGWQFILVPCFLAALGASARMLSFFAAMAVALLAVDVIFLLWPADNAVALWGASDPVPLLWSRALHGLIAARDPIYDVTASRLGLISFPSFHTAGAVIVVWALRRTILFWPLLLLECLLLLGVPAWGGHYFVDMLAGLIVAAAAIFTTAQSRSRRGRSR